MLTAPVMLLAFVTAQRAIELALSRRNTRRLLRRGAYEIGAEHYPLIVGLHASWLATLWLFGHAQPIIPAFVGLFILLQIARIGVLGTLGERWTTRVIILPGAPRVRAGPYRFLAHPIVALELPCLSLALGLPWHAALFGCLNLAVLALRLRVEEAGLAKACADA